MHACYHGYPMISIKSHTISGWCNSSSAFETVLKSNIYCQTFIPHVMTSSRACASVHVNCVWLLASLIWSELIDTAGPSKIEQLCILCRAEGVAAGMVCIAYTTYHSVAHLILLLANPQWLNRDIWLWYVFTYVSTWWQTDRLCGAFTDLTETLLEGGRDFSIQDLQNRFDIFPCSISTQITGKQTEEVCEHTQTQTHKHTHTRVKSEENSALSQEGRPLTRSCSKEDRSYNVNTVLMDKAACNTSTMTTRRRNRERQTEINRMKE